MESLWLGVSYCGKEWLQGGVVKTPPPHFPWRSADTTRMGCWVALPLSPSLPLSRDTTGLSDYTSENKSSAQRELQSDRSRT